MISEWRTRNARRTHRNKGAAVVDVAQRVLSIVGVMVVVVNSSRASAEERG